MILRLNELSGQARIRTLQDLRKIFFEASSVKKFRDAQHRENFFFRWCGAYLQDTYPSAFLAFQDDTLLGYLIYSTLSPLESAQYQPGGVCFKDFYEEFPAHLHMNCHHLARSQGVGSRLIKALCVDLQQRQIPGVHIITSPDQANVEFYRKVGFLCESLREYGESKLLFMGKKISRLGEREDPTSRSL